jgi:hypothetical protein
MKNLNIVEFSLGVRDCTVPLDRGKQLQIDNLSDVAETYQTSKPVHQPELSNNLVFLIICQVQNNASTCQP